MEELQSTDVLDHEILEDARKKALRILKHSDDTINAQNSKWENNLIQTIKNLDMQFNEQEKNETHTIMSRLPVDKQRIKIEKTEELLNYALESWYKSLKREKVLDLLYLDLLRLLTACDDFKTNSKIHIEISALNKEEACIILKKLKIPESTLAEIVIKNTEDIYPLIILDTGSVRISSSIETLITNILLEKRKELIEALTGKTFMGDL